MDSRMRLGDLLIQAKLISPEDLAIALQRQAEGSGRLGDQLVAMGAITAKALDKFLHRMPAEPVDIHATGINENELLSFMMKAIYASHLETALQFVKALKLPYHVVIELVRMAIDRQMMRTLGSRDSSGLGDMVYVLTEVGKNWVQLELQQSRYSGAVPVSLEAFTEMVNLQKITNEIVTFERVRKSFGDLTISDQIVEKCGPALNSGRAMLLYGPPGNGKTSVAMSFAGVFDDVIYVPYSVLVEGQVIRVFDPSYHILQPLPESSNTGNDSFVRREEFDARWIPCRRPFIIAGGELTLEMLDLRFEAVSNIYEAPLHIKALGGCFIIDDFGRQLVSPTALLNRWIVPLENRIDYLKLHTGKTFTLPFEEMVIFSTNLEPEDLMDPAFLRRLPYKIEVGAPTLEQYKEIFNTECLKHGMALSDELFEMIVQKITVEKGMDLAAYHPKFISDQVAATCRFMGKAPHFEPRFIDHAIDNLRVRHASEPRPVSAG